MLLVAPASGANDARVRDLLIVQAVEGRMASVGNRLARSAGELCPDTAHLAGFQVHDASQYGGGAQDDLVKAFGAGPWPKVIAVARGSAAERAGLRANDSILSIDGRAIPAPPKRRKAYDRVAEVLDLLDRGVADGALRLEIRRDGRAMAVQIAADRGCRSRFQLKIADKVDAKADGRYVEVTTGTVGFVADDAELAAIIAHELAHNILGHPARLKAAGIQRGILQNFGRSARLTRETEVEADRLSVHLMDRAGYPMRAAVRMWQHYPASVLDWGAWSHPSDGERIRIIEAEIAKIEAAKARGETPRFVP